MTQDLELVDKVKRYNLALHHLLLSAKENIDQVYGMGFSEKNPTLVSGYIQAASNLFGQSEILKEIDNIAGAIRGISEKIEGLDYTNPPEMK